MQNLINNITKRIVGNDDKIKIIIAAILANGNVLLEDNPGTGKTSLVKALVNSINGVNNL